MLEYKLFASDLDGTMLNSKGEFTVENLNAIEKMREKGIEFVPVTGRCIAEMDQSIIGSGIKYMINSNGASIYNVETKVAHITEIKKEALKKIFDILSKYEVLLIAHSNNDDLVEASLRSDEVFDYHKMSRAYKEIILPTSTPIENLKERLLTDTPAEMLALFFRNEKERVECVKEFEKLTEISFTSSTGGNMEVLDATVSKGNAIKKLSSVLGVKPSEIIVAGDNYNDISMTDVAGLSLAVSGAVGEMKQKCDKTICSNNDHVADYVYRNFIDI